MLNAGLQPSRKISSTNTKITWLTLIIGIREKRNPKSEDNTLGFQQARQIITSYWIVTMTMYFGNVVHVETKHNTAETSIVVSMAHAMVE